MPIFGQLVEKNTLARTTRTLGTLISSGVPILEALNITSETSGNAMFEKLYGRVSDVDPRGRKHRQAAQGTLAGQLQRDRAVVLGDFHRRSFGALMYVLRMNQRVVDDLVVNMVDVGEETGELDTMLYKVADTYDEEVAVLTESLTKLMEPLLIICPGRGGRVHRDRAVHAAGRADHEPHRRRRRRPPKSVRDTGRGKVRSM